MADKSRKRHIAKAITWRFIGTLDTILLSWIISGNLYLGFKIGIFEVITKMVLYYIHERIWYRLNIHNSNRRHILKTFSWRLIGSLDTFILAWLILSNPVAGMKISIAEVVTKMILYYGHERIWYLFDFGLEKNSRRKK